MELFCVVRHHCRGEAGNDMGQSPVCKIRPFLLYLGGRNCTLFVEPRLVLAPLTTVSRLPHLRLQTVLCGL
jgi:hypothetical protein